jgi:threonine dehydrogenase-like Zn-dependent dehydrogenase
MQAVAAILHSFGAPLRLEQIEVPALLPDQVLVEIEAAGVCGSDVHMWHGQDPRTPLPMILGHEGVGRVVDIAGDKHDIHGQRLAPGDRILWERSVTCGQCYYCAVLHEPALCPHRWVYGIHRSAAIAPHLNGCYATHVILDARTQVFPLAADEDPALWVAASCSGATAAHGFELSPAHVGDTVVVLGPGALGAFSVALARAAGAAHIVVIGGTPARLEICRQLGATVALNRQETTLAERLQCILDLTHGRGADLVVEASGSVSAAQEGLELLRHGGALSLVGFGTPVGTMTFLPFEALVRKNARIQGVWVSDARHTFRALSLIRSHPQAFAALITHRFALRDATHALQAMADRAALKAVLQTQV